MRRDAMWDNATSNCMPRKTLHLNFLEGHHSLVGVTHGSVDLGELTAADFLVHGQAVQGGVLVGGLVGDRELHNGRFSIG